MSPAAALRVLRIAAGRRALELVLLLGGLFAIGLLCGGQASAADGVSAVPASGVSAVSASGVSVGTSSTSSADLRASAGSEAERGERAERVLSVPAKPGVRDESTVASKPGAPQYGEGESEAQAIRPAPAFPSAPAFSSAPVLPASPSLPSLTPLPSLPSLLPPPSMPEAPESPAWPSWPGLDLPEFPGLPGADIPALPGVPAVPAKTLPAIGAGASQPEAQAPGSVDGRDDDEGRTGEEAAVAYGPRFVALADDTGTHVPAADGARSVASAGYIPVQHAPVDHPGGVLGNRSAGDNSTSRHGDAHAVSLNPRAPLRLAPGAAARVEADEIQDRHRDIPVSPA
ncbi:hypothetical protein [Streptomyces sp. AC550_RSS872]|uniref:hypothetical protein n=1 Tax=Streptomyces sp. AC550_RSS872 TaxID=2823689 RepID=UPI001C2640CA|nr:hypothetical protein [Streptomyces sp. AC550_RSS872]